MKVAGCIFQNKFIEENTKDEFIATYKGYRFVITTDHGFGEPEYKHLKRFNIDVYGVECGLAAVCSVKDFHSIKDAIIYALKGAMFIN